MDLGSWRSRGVVAAAFVLLAAAMPLTAQGTITGRVTASGTGQPLADARVLVIGTTLATSTAEDVKFTLRNAPAGNLQLQVLRVGYQSQKKAVTVVNGQSTTSDFTLNVAIAQLRSEERRVTSRRCRTGRSRRRRAGRPPPSRTCTRRWPRR